MRERPFRLLTCQWEQKHVTHSIVPPTIPKLTLRSHAYLYMASLVKLVPEANFHTISADQEIFPLPL